MKYYIIEKTLPKNYTSADIIELNDLLLNAEKVHKLLGKLFNTEKEANWRKKYNILYRQLESGKWFVSSEKEISDTMAEQLAVKVTPVNMPKLNVGSPISFKLALSPFRPDKANGGKRKRIKDRNERIDWLKQKLTYNGECEVLSINEFDLINRYMEHEDENKGKVALTGYEYTLALKIKDLDKFTTLMNEGIGPCKNYGYGLLTAI